MTNTKRSVQPAIWLAFGFLLSQPNGALASELAIGPDFTQIKPEHASLSNRAKQGKPPACPENPDTDCPPSSRPTPSRPKR